MSRDDGLARISIDPHICFGKPCIRGHRIGASLILDFLASGWSTAEILANYPGLEEADIQLLYCLRRRDGQRALRGDLRFARHIKLDENLGERGRELFAKAGHDVRTVKDQGLEGAVDTQVIDVCRAEGRCLVTLDLDFSNPILFPPERYSGIAVIRLPRRVSPDDLYAAVGALIAAPGREPIAGKLWIVERHRIRVYLADEEESAP